MRVLRVLGLTGGLVAATTMVAFAQTSPGSGGGPPGGGGTAGASPPSGPGGGQQPPSGPGSPGTIPGATGQPGPGGGPAAKPTLEELLTKALQQNPDVQVAEAKLREAEALLRQTRMQVAQKLVETHTSVELQQQLFNNAESYYRMFTKPGVGSNIEKSIAESQMLTVKRQLAQLEATVDALTGRLPVLNQNLTNAIALQGMPIGAGFQGLVGGGGGVPMVGGFGPGDSNDPKPRMPKRPMADKMRAALEQPYKMPDRFQKEIMITEIVAHLRGEVKGVPFLSALGQKAEEPVAIDFRGEVTLAAYLQLLGDTIPDLRVIVRDYGFMITIDGKEPNDGMTLADFLAASGKHE